MYVGTVRAFHSGTTSKICQVVINRLDFLKQCFDHELCPCGHVLEWHLSRIEGYYMYMSESESWLGLLGVTKKSPEGQGMIL